MFDSMRLLLKLVSDENCMLVRLSMLELGMFEQNSVLVDIAYIYQHEPISYQHEYHIGSCWLVLY